MRFPKLSLFIAALGCGAAVFAFAQTTSPLPGPFPEDPTPKPFPYPEGLTAPQFTLEENPASVVSFGDFPIQLGVTPLSVITKAFGGELHHLPDRSDYLCYSAPLQPSKKPKSRTQKNVEPAEQEPAPIGQNIWFMIGPKGEISEARAQVVREGSELCPALPEEYSNVAFGPFRIGVPLSAQELKKAQVPEPSVVSEDTPWRYWFSTNKETIPIHYGFLAIENNETFGPTTIFSTELHFDRASR